MCGVGKEKFKAGVLETWVPGPVNLSWPRSPHPYKEKTRLHSWSLFQFKTLLFLERLIRNNESERSGNFRLTEQER